MRLPLFFSRLAPTLLACTLAACSQRPLPATSLAPSSMAGGAGGFHYRSLYSFDQNGAGGWQPQAGLHAANGLLYGTTSQIGEYSSGTAFEISNRGKLRTLATFSGSDAANPLGDLIEVGGAFYGTTYYGGTGNCSVDGAGCGTVFALRRSRNGFKVSVIYSFQGFSDGRNPKAGLVWAHGALWGTTYYGGIVKHGGCNQPDGCGTVFSVTLAGRERVEHSFANFPDGILPEGRLLALGSTLYGTTSYGGKFDSGAVFSISVLGEERVLYSFDGSTGAYPASGLVEVNGTLYGTTQGGGTYDGGTIFSIRPSGQAGSILYAFGSRKDDGSFPHAGLVYLNGVLYGTTANGGAHGFGAVFAVSPSGKDEHTVYSFNGHGTDGWGPVADLTVQNGLLYGTTQRGGSKCSFPGCGTVFEIRP